MVLIPARPHRNRIKREVLKEIFSDPKLRAYRYRDLRTFRNILVVEGDVVDADGEITLNLLLAESPQFRPDRLKEARDDSSQRRAEMFWVVTQTDEIHSLTRV
jgi:hypothetical protein